MSTQNIQDKQIDRIELLKERIIRKAIEIIKEAGLCGIGMRPLAKAVGYSTPMIYSYGGKLKAIRTEACKLLKIEYADRPDELIDILSK